MAEEFLTASGQPQLAPTGGGTPDANTVKVTGADANAQFLSPKIGVIRGVTKAITGVGTQQLQLGLPGPITNPSPGVPLVYLGTSDEYVPAQPPFAFPVIQATTIAPNESAFGSSEVAIRSGGGYVGLIAADSDAVVFAALGGNANVGCNGDGKSTNLQVTNTASLSFTLLECTLTGESNDTPAIGAYGAPPAVQPTVGGDTHGDLAALQQVVRNMLTALETIGWWIDGTV